MKHPSRNAVFTALFALGTLSALTAATAAQAQNYPSRPIRMLCPIAPGGGLDVIARAIAPGLSEIGRAHV